MRILIGEYICGGGLVGVHPEEIPTSLQREGEAMLRAIAQDLAEVAETVVPVDPRMAISLPESSRVVPMDPDQPVWTQWVQAARDCDAALIVAPERDGVLAKAVGVLRAAGIDVIAGSGDFLRVAGDKLLTAKTLVAAGVAHPPYYALSDRRCREQLKQRERFVVKPRDGCGTQDIRIYDSFDEARADLEENLILQAWRPGRAVSVAMIASHAQQVFLPTVAQQLDPDTLQYSGGHGPLDADAQRRATNLASLAISAMPPTVRGFVGVDLVLGEDSHDDCVIEINARLTTSYVGLRRMVQGNLAARLFDLESGPVVCSTPADAVRWSSDGQVWINDSAASQV